jgi:TRAP-type C4-dicarboxylate transport system substrate-binding protein
MKKMGFLPVLGCICFLIMAFVTSPGPAFAEPVVLQWVSILPKMSPETRAFQKYFVDRVNEGARGELVIKYRGGPEAIAPPNIATAVHKGVADICTVFVGFYEVIVPGIGALMLTDYTPQEERRPGGIYDSLVEIHKKGGLMYLGRASPSVENFFYTFLNKKVTKPEDFKKLKLGSGPAARAAAMAWGSKVTPIRGVADYYPGMERGLFDGVPSCPLITWVALGCQEVTKYIVDHPYYQSTVSAIMNLDSWNKLSSPLQKLMIETMNEYSKYVIPEHTEDLTKARKKAIDAGVEFYKFSPEVADWFLTTAYDAAWEYQQKRFPEVTPQLKKLLKK